VSALTDLTDLTSRVTRLLSDTIVSGTYTENELRYFVQDATAAVPFDYPDFTTYTVDVTTGITPSPTKADGYLLSLKAAVLAYFGICQELIGDAVAIRSGSISLDTSRSLRAKSLEFDRLENSYNKIIDNLLTNISGADTSGYRVDIYQTLDNEVSDSESLND